MQATPELSTVFGYIEAREKEKLMLKLKNRKEIQNEFSELTNNHNELHHYDSVEMIEAGSFFFKHKDDPTKNFFATMKVEDDRAVWRNLPILLRREIETLFSQQD